MKARARLLTMACAGALFLMGAGPGFAADGEIAVVKAEISTPQPPPAGALGCLDDPDYYCFSKCDNFWDWCVEGSNGCVMVWALDKCADNYQLTQCCVIAIRAGLF